MIIFFSMVWCICVKIRLQKSILIGLGLMKFTSGFKVKSSSNIWHFLEIILIQNREKALRKLPWKLIFWITARTRLQKSFFMQSLDYFGLVIKCEKFQRIESNKMLSNSLVLDINCLSSSPKPVPYVPCYLSIIRKGSGWLSCQVKFAPWLHYYDDSTAVIRDFKIII